MVYPLSFICTGSPPSAAVDIHASLSAQFIEYHAEAFAQFPGSPPPTIVHSFEDGHSVSVIQYDSLFFSPGDIYVLARELSPNHSWLIVWELAGFDVQFHAPSPSAAEFVNATVVGAGRPRDDKRDIPRLFPNPRALVHKRSHEQLRNPHDVIEPIQILQERFQTEDVVAVPDPDTGYVREYQINQGQIIHRPYLEQDPQIRDKLFPGNEHLRFDIVEELLGRQLVLPENIQEEEKEFMTAEDYAQHFAQPYDVIAVKAPFSYRKTTSLFGFLAEKQQEHPNAFRVILPSVRRTHAEDSGRTAHDFELRFDCYLHVDGSLDACTNIIVSVESLLRVSETWLAKGPFILMLDEAGEVLRILTSSKTVRERGDVSRAFDRLVSNATRVVMMSADLCADDVARILERRPENKRALGVGKYRKPLEHATSSRVVPIADPAEWKASLLRDVMAGRRLVIVSASRRKLEEIQIELDKDAISYLVIHGLTDDAAIEILKDDSQLMEKQCLLYTGAVGSGV